MPVLFFKALECEVPSLELDTNVRLKIKVDGKEKNDIKLGSFTHRDRKRLSNTIEFAEKIEIDLKADSLKIGETLVVRTNELPHSHNNKPGWHRAAQDFKGKPSGAKSKVIKKIINFLKKHFLGQYKLWFEVIPVNTEAADFHNTFLLPEIRLREIFGRTGRGVFTAEEQSAAASIPFEEGVTRKVYRCRETISIRDAVNLHKKQNRNKEPAGSLRRWIRQHANPWGEESVIPLAQLPGGVNPSALLSNPNWIPVMDERSCVLSGLVTDSRFAGEDNPATHMSRDWIFNTIPSPVYNYMLAYTAKTKKITVNSGNVLVPLSHNEWESGSMPVEWRPMKGEFVTITGRHIFDMGHMPVTTEVHPPHTIIREFTEDNTNHAIVGMGFSGGFPGSVKAELSGELDARWNNEFGGFLPGLSLRNRRCWATNLKKHKLKFKLFPPDARPHSFSVLEKDNAIKSWRIIIIQENQVNDFLASCGAGGIEGEQKKHAFNAWFFPGLQMNPLLFKPKITVEDSWLDVEIDLSAVDGIPVAYMAELTCEWTR